MFGVMAIAITLAKAGHNRLRYLLSTTSTGADTGQINTIGGVSGAVIPDLQTDLLTGLAGGGGVQPLPAAGNQGPLMLLAKVVAQGYGQFAAGVQTQAKARALWLADRSGANPASGNDFSVGPDIVPSAKCQITPLSHPAGAGWFVDANVDGGGNPIITVASLAAGPEGLAYLDIFVGDTIGE
jgi:hypothetical protein